MTSDELIDKLREELDLTSRGGDMDRVLFLGRVRRLMAEYDGIDANADERAAALRELKAIESERMQLAGRETIARQRLSEATP